MVVRILVAAVLALGMVAGATAETKKGPNGGIVVMADDHPVEFVHRGQDISFYLNDHDGKPMPTKGLQARAVVQDAGKTVNVTLAPAAPNLFAGKLAAPLGPKARVVFSTRIHDHAVQARFVTD
jgi:hypothetical protein